MEKENTCSCCGSVVVYRDPQHNNIDIEATHKAIVKKVSEKSMVVIKGDCPLSEMLELLESDMKYTVVQFLRCDECKNVIFWGLCIRGKPIYKISDENSISKWPWENDIIKKDGKYYRNQK